MGSAVEMEAEDSPSKLRHPAKKSRTSGYVSARWNYSQVGRVRKDIAVWVSANSSELLLVEPLSTYRQQYGCFRRTSLGLVIVFR